MKTTAYIFFALMIAGCDIFTARDAEPPDQTGSNYPPAIVPDTVITNMMNSFKDKDAVNYRNAIVDQFSGKQFVYVPSSSAFLRFSDTWVDWDIDSEESYFTGIVSSVPDQLPITLDLSISPESFSYTGDEITYISDYSLSVPQTDGSDLLYVGNLEFKMININTVWKIYYWKDNAIEDLLSWSDLKGLNYH